MKRRIWITALGLLAALLIQQTSAYAGDPNGSGENIQHHTSHAPSESASATKAPTPTATATVTPTATKTATASPTATQTPQPTATTVQPSPTSTPLVPVGDSLPVTGPGVGSLIVAGLAMVGLGFGLVMFVRGRRRSHSFLP